MTSIFLFTELIIGRVGIVSKEFTLLTIDKLQF